MAFKDPQCVFWVLSSIVEVLECVDTFESKLGGDVLAHLESHRDGFLRVEPAYTCIEVILDSAEVIFRFVQRVEDLVATAEDYALKSAIDRCREAK